MKERTEQQWKAASNQPVSVEIIGGTVYGFTTEIGALRLFHAYNRVNRNNKTDMGFSEGYKTWYFRLEID